MPRFWIETLGCPKNSVDSDKLAGVLGADGYEPAEGPEGADLVVVNTCAFIEQAREESLRTVLDLDEVRPDGSRLVVTGCLAERHGDEVAAALPEVDLVAGFGVPVQLGTKPDHRVLTVASEGVPVFDLLNLQRPPSARPWAYVKIAEGCDRACGFCAIPSFRGPQRSRSVESILEEVRALDVAEVVLVAQDLASYGRDGAVGLEGDAGAGPGSTRPIVQLVEQVAGLVERTRLLYLYPSDLTDGLIDVMCSTGMPYFDLSLQHVSRPLLRRMRRWGDGDRFLARIEAIRAREPEAAFRSNFIVGYPGETESDHDELLAFVEAAQLDWCGFFPYSPEQGTYAEGLDGRVPDTLVSERLAELGELQDAITARRRDALIGTTMRVLVDEPGSARSHREAPEIDGVVVVPEHLVAGTFVDVQIVDAAGPDLIGEPIGGGA